MKSKYYTPDISEFHVGFECEIKDLDGSKTTISGNPEKDKPVFKNKYKKEVYIIEDWFRIWQGLDNNNIRVKYLDKSDIESLGFNSFQKAVCNWYKLEGRFSDSFASYGYWSKIRLIHCTNNNVIKILAYEYSWDEEENVLYAGKCNNKSELIKLLKQLNIVDEEEKKS